MFTNSMLQFESLTATFTCRQQFTGNVCCRALVSQSYTMCVAAVKICHEPNDTQVCTQYLSAACRSAYEPEQEAADLPAQKRGVTTSTGPQVGAFLHLSMSYT